MKRQVIISGDFTITEVSNAQGTETEKIAPVSHRTTKAQQRIDALRASGICVDNFFAMGDNMIVKVVDGIPSMVDDDDPIFQEISKGGYICHYKLFRRWVMSQMFHILRNMELYKCDMTRILNFHGYEYEWRMVEKEFLAQYKMHEHGDTECFAERNAWFNKYTVVGMTSDYINYLRKYLERIKTHISKRREYKILSGKRIYLDSMDEMLFAPIMTAIRNIQDASTPKELYEAVCKFNKVRHHFRHGNAPDMDKTFIDAYKGAGGYFTCKNLILFHGCRVHKRTMVLSQEESLKELEDMKKMCSEEFFEGWRMIGFMKELIQDNNISVAGKIAEWKK